MTSYPYAQPISGLEQIIKHMRKSPQKEMNASKLKALSIAPNNESYIVNTLRALGLFDEEGKAIEPKMGLFYKSDDTEFSQELSKLLQETYSGLFDVHSDAWTIERSKLINFFRVTDKSSDLVGSRQADTFIKLAELAQKRQPATARTVLRTATKTESTKSDKNKKTVVDTRLLADRKQNRGSENGIALTVRVEVNLPGDGTAETYDAIFKSIRENLIN